MLNEHEITVTDKGSGYTIGEVPSRHKQLDYLRAGALVCLFEGTDQLLDYVSEKMPTAKRGESSISQGRSGFHAFDSYEEAMTTFRSTPEKVVKFDPSELRIKDEQESGTQVEYDVTGDFIDMGRYMEGIPETMGTMHSGNARNRRVNIMVNLNQRSGMPHEDITHRGERILRLVDALEAGGVRAMITGIESNECGHTEIILKHHDEPLTISDLAVVTHPEFLRRTIFRINEYSNTWDSGYGSAVKFSELLTPELIEVGASNSELNIVVDSNLSGISSIDNTFDQLERLLVWEMGKPVTEVSAIKLNNHGIYFNANGNRDEAEIRREGAEVIKGE